MRYVDTLKKEEQLDAGSQQKEFINAWDQEKHHQTNILLNVLLSIKFKTPGFVKLCYNLHVNCYRALQKLFSYVYTLYNSLKGHDFYTSTLRPSLTKEAII